MCHLCPSFPPTGYRLRTPWNWMTSSALSGGCCNDCAVRGPDLKLWRFYLLAVYPSMNRYANNKGGVSPTKCWRPESRMYFDFGVFVSIKSWGMGAKSNHETHLCVVSTSWVACRMCWAYSYVVCICGIRSAVEPFYFWLPVDIKLFFFFLSILVFGFFLLGVVNITHMKV